MVKLSKSDIAAAERVVYMAERSNGVGVCFGMTSKTTRLFAKLLAAAKEHEAESAQAPISGAQPVENSSVRKSKIGR